MIYALTASWCGPCKRMRPVFDALIPEGLVYFDIDENPEVAERYDVKSVPTLIRVDSDGNETNRLVGVNPPNVVASWAAAL